MVLMEHYFKMQVCICITPCIYVQKNIEMGNIFKSFAVKENKNVLIHHLQVGFSLYDLS